MRVLYSSTSGQIGGASQSLLTLCKALPAYGVEPFVVCVPGPFLQACQDLGIPAAVLEHQPPSWRRPLRSWRAYRRWCRLLRKARTDLVHTNGLRAACAVSFAARRARLPVVCHVRFLGDPKTDDMSFLLSVFRGVPKPDYFVFNSHSLQQQGGAPLARACPAAKQRVIYNAVDLSAFRPRPKTAGAPLRVGIIGNFGPVKGHPDFLAMARLLLDRGQACEFWIVGEDGLGYSGYRDQLLRLGAELNLNGQVKYLGYRQDVAHVLNELDIVVSSSHYESFGRTLIEAMACERPVVATAVGGVPEVVKDGETGFLVPARQPAAMAAAVEKLLLNDQLRRDMGRAGRVRVEALFDASAHVAQVVRLYEDILGRQRSTPLASGDHR